MSNQTLDVMLRFDRSEVALYRTIRAIARERGKPITEVERATDLASDENILAMEIIDEIIREERRP